MAITRAQQAKQMLQNGGRIGLRFGNRGPGQSSRESRDARDRGMGMGGKQRSAPAPVGGGGRDDRRGGQYSSPEGIAVNRQIDRDRRNEEFRKTLIETISPSTKLPNRFARIGLNIFAPGLGELFARAVDRRPTYLMSEDRNDLMPEDDNDSQFILPQTRFAQAPSTTDQETKTEEDPFELALAFRKDGGRIGAMDGGIMNSGVVGGEFDFESARQMYGLGKLVKKVTRSVKKIAKSPIGKAALLYAGGTYLGGLKAFGGAGFGQGNFLTNLKSGQGIGNLARFASGKLFGNVAYDDAVGTRTGGLFDKLGVGSSIIGVSALAGLLTPEEEQQAKELADNANVDIEKARNSILAARREQYMMDERARGFKAEGGPAEGKEPVAKKTMPLLDMGGQEMDLRAEGGFVPIGRMEKADDVPARLSKNEFVFTADAVRNAGDGDVDKGGEVMYNMMKNLESGGDVSEESQGLEGARKMFQTSQRLEEVL